MTSRQMRFMLGESDTTREGRHYADRVNGIMRCGNCYRRIKTKSEIKGIDYCRVEDHTGRSVSLIYFCLPCFKETYGIDYPASRPEPP
jgi:hypothetical protein